jgi:hypothetical protein
MSSEFTPSNLKIEEDTIIESQSLIAIGANNTLSAPSTLVEYAYIYEDIISDEKLRGETLKKMSEKTVEAIKDYFNLSISS